MPVIDPIGLGLDTHPGALENETPAEQIERQAARIKELEAAVEAAASKRLTSGKLYNLKNGANGPEALLLTGAKEAERADARAKVVTSKSQTKEKLAAKKRLGESVFKALNEKEYTLNSFKNQTGAKMLKALLYYAEISCTGVTQMDKLRTLAAGAVVDLEARPALPDLALPAAGRRRALPQRRTTAAVAGAGSDSESESDPNGPDSEPEASDTESDIAQSGSESDWDEDRCREEAAAINSRLRPR